MPAVKKSKSKSKITRFSVVAMKNIEKIDFSSIYSDEAIKKYALVSDILCFNNNFLHIELYPIH